MLNQSAIKLANVSKVFPNGVVANKKVNFDLKYGEIHALFGENGAGKSTLVKIMFGEISPTEGQIFINDQEIENHTPVIASSLNMGIVHQHFALIKNFSVFENLILGHEFRSTKKLKLIEKDYQNRLDKINEWLQNQVPANKTEQKNLQHQYNKKIRKLQIWKEKKVISFSIGGKKMLGEIAAIKKKFKLNLDTKSYIRDLSLEKQQKVEILKVLIKNTKIIIFDEPTSVLGLKEIKDFMESLKIYRAEGKAIVFITHKVDEISQVADRVSVMRRGEILGTFDVKKTSRKNLISLMVGGKSVFSLKEATRKSVLKDKLLEVKNLHFKGETIAKSLHKINFSLHKGEILGIAGIEDNGQKELFEIIAGMENKFKGEIYFDSPSSFFPLKPQKKINSKSQTWNKLGVQMLRKAGISYVSYNRLGESLLPTEPLFVNFSFNNLQNYELFDAGLLQIFREKKARQAIANLVDSFQIKGVTSPEQLANALSGGNQQKFIIARELWNQPSLLLINQPTWGIDVLSIGLLYQFFLKHRNEGKSLIFASSDLNEILSLSDRVLVISKGTIIGEVNPTTKNARETIGELMSKEVSL